MEVAGVCVFTLCCALLPLPGSEQLRTPRQWHWGNAPGNRTTSVQTCRLVLIPRAGRSTSSCSSSESSSLTTGLARLRPLRRLRAFPRSPPLSFLPRRIFTLTERAGAESRGLQQHYRGHHDEGGQLLCCLHSDSDPSSSSSSSSSLSSPSLSSSFSIFCRRLVKTDCRTMESSYIFACGRNGCVNKERNALPAPQKGFSQRASETLNPTNGCCLSRGHVEDTGAVFTSDYLWNRGRFYQYSHQRSLQVEGLSVLKEQHDISLQVTQTAVAMTPNPLLQQRGGGRVKDRRYCSDHSLTAFTLIFLKSTGFRINS